jgi:DNA-binding beta-propeller fold protein YncE
MRFHLIGNLEPEAFSSDDSALFLIRYLPPMDPTSYRVVRLELASGDTYPVFGRDKSPVETMTGTRLQQVPSGDGSHLFTLYTDQPPEYADGFDEDQAGASEPVSFIHTLNLADGFAICVGLPKSFWGGDPDDEALAVSPDGRSLYVVDAVRGVATVINADRLKVTRTTAVAFGLATPSGSKEVQTHAVVSFDGAWLFVARGDSVVRLDATTLSPQATWRIPAAISGMALSADGLRLYVSMENQIGVVDPSTGRDLRMVHASVDGSVQGITTAAA